MKKVLFAVVAMIAIGFAACTNKAQAPAEAEGVDVSPLFQGRYFSLSLSFKLLFDSSSNP